MKLLEGTLSVLSALGQEFVPRMRLLYNPTYRRLARETRAYEYDFGDYRPYLGNHEVPMRVGNSTRARIVYERVLSAEAERVAEIRRLLEREGLAVEPTRSAWDAIAAWVYRRIEGSREPGSTRYHPYVRNYPEGLPPVQVRGESTTKPRPIWYSIAFDLSLLLGHHMIEAVPGFRWVLDADLPGCEGSAYGAPQVLRRGVAEMPFSLIEDLTLNALESRLGLAEPDLNDLGKYVEGDFPYLPGPDEPADFIAELRSLFEEQPELATLDEVGFILAEHRLLELPPLPPDLARKLEQIG